MRKENKMTTKTVFNSERLPPETQRAANLDQNYYNKSGINGDPLIESNRQA